MQFFMYWADDYSERKRILNRKEWNQRNSLTKIDEEDWYKGN